MKVDLKEYQLQIYIPSIKHQVTRKVIIEDTSIKMEGDGKILYIPFDIIYKIEKENNEIKIVARHLNNGFFRIFSHYSKNKFVIVCNDDTIQIYDEIKEKVDSVNYNEKSNIILKDMMGNKINN